MVAAGAGPSGPSVNEGSEARCFAGLQETGEGDDASRQGYAGLEIAKKLRGRRRKLQYAKAVG